MQKNFVIDILRAPSDAWESDLQWATGILTSLLHLWLLFKDPLGFDLVWYTYTEWEMWSGCVQMSFVVREQGLMRGRETQRNTKHRRD